MTPKWVGPAQKCSMLIYLTIGTTLYEEIIDHRVNPQKNIQEIVGILRHYMLSK